MSTEPITKCPDCNGDRFLIVDGVEIVCVTCGGEGRVVAEPVEELPDVST